METQNPAKQPTILVVDDSAHDYETYVRYLGKASPNTYRTKFLSVGKQVLHLDELPHCLLLDLSMPDITGLDILRKLKKQNRGSLPFPVVMVTGSGDEYTGRKAVQLGAQDYLIKDEVTPASLKRAVDFAVTRFHLEQKVRESEERAQRLAARLTQSQTELEQKVTERTQQLADSLTAVQAEVVIRKQIEVQLRELSARILRLQDEERGRIARDLHDSTGQTLTALKMTAAALQISLGEITPQSSAMVDDLNALADQALQEIRTLSHLLHPPLLDEVGFHPAARWYVDGFSQRSGIKSSLDLSAAPPLHKDAELALFRVLQESLTNVLKHSASSAVEVSLYSEGASAVLSIHDHGKGIPLDKLTQFNATGAGVGVGLGGMKQRIRDLGGELKVESDGSGTKICASVPMIQANRESARYEAAARRDPAA